MTLAFIGPLPAWRWTLNPSPLIPKINETLLKVLRHLPPCPRPRAVHLLSVGGEALPPVPSTVPLSEAPRWSSARAQRDKPASFSSKAGWATCRPLAILTHSGSIKHWAQPRRRASTWTCRLRRTDRCRRSSSVFADKSMLWASAVRLLIYKGQTGQMRVHGRIKEDVCFVWHVQPIW